MGDLVPPLDARVAALEDKILHLEIALQSSRQIGAAVGILMCQRRITEEAAFGLLIRASQNSHRKVRDVAADVMLTGDLERD